MKAPKLANLFCIIVLTAAMTGMTQIASAQGLVWGKDLTKGLQAAATEKKWVMVDMYTDWCSWCKKLDTDVYTDPSVMKLLKRSFVLVKVNGDDTSLGKYVKTRYHLEERYPTIIVLYPNGKLKGTINGFLAPSDFVAEVSRIVRE